MTPEQTFEQLLGLGTSWKVIRTEFEVERNTFVICVTETEALWSQESAACGQTVTCYDHVEPMPWRHLNVFNKECVIVSALPRGRRSQDGKIYRVTPPWEGRSKHFSKEFEAFALTLMREMPVKKAGEILGENDQRLWRMLHAHVEAARARADWSEVVWVGADEMNRRKGHNYVTVFADLVGKRVLFGTEGKDASVWASFAQELQAHNGHPKAITEVAIDMSKAYRKGVKENFGNANLSFDKFHVVGRVVEAVDEVRREERSQPDRGELLAKARWLFRKNPENWTEKEEARWEKLAQENLATGLAYQMRLVFQGIYKLGCAKLAREKLQSWCEWVEQAGAQAGKVLEPMKKVAAMVREHFTGILGHWKQGLTTAYLEGLNSLFSATKRKARGYRTTKNLLAMLYFVAGKLRVPCY
jgi:transposase